MHQHDYFIYFIYDWIVHEAQTKHRLEHGATQCTNKQIEQTNKKKKWILNLLINTDVISYIGRILIISLSSLLWRPRDLYMSRDLRIPGSQSLHKRS